MKRLLSLTTLVLVLVLGSCSDLTDLNEDPKNPAEVPAETLFSNAQMSLGTYLNSSDINENIFKFMGQYWAATTYATESQYELTTRAIPSNLWSELYRDVLNDLNEARILIDADELLADDIKQNQLAAITVMEALTYSTLVDIFGDLPYEEALDIDNTQPTFDDAATIYADLLNRLNTAIGNFNTSADVFTGADIYYSGDTASWIRFANSLKMRLGITLADVNPSVAQAAIEEASPNAFTSNDHNAEIPFETSPPHTSPLWEDLVQSGRDDYVPANTLIDTMNALDDPRRAVQFTQVEGEYVGGIYGSTNAFENFSHFSDLTQSPDFPGMILGYDEVEFIRAEAAARGWSVSSTEEEHYENGIRADMEWWGVPTADIDTYVAQANVIYDPAGDFRAQIALQKWLGLYLQGIRGWTVWRRLDNPTFNVPPTLSSVDDIPLRFTYPVDEQNLNQSNWQAAADAIGGDELSTPLFWDMTQP